MSRGLLGIAGALAVGTALVVAPAGAQKAQPVPSATTLTAVSGTKVAINKYIQDTSHFTPGTFSIKSGATLTLKNVGGQPHTFSIVKPTQVPKTAKAVEQCKVCQDIAKAHGADPNSDAPPKQLVVDVGSAGDDQAGDSVFFMKTTKVKITAKKGTTLSFICAIHPWMQGKLIVR